MLYSLFGHIDFVSVSALRLEYWEISIHWHAENTSSITKNINLRFLPDRHTSSNTWKSERFGYILLSSTPPPPSSPTKSPSKINSSYYTTWKATAIQTVQYVIVFLCLCSMSSVRSCAFVICMCLCIIYVCALLIAAGTWGCKDGSV